MQGNRTNEVCIFGQIHLQCRDLDSPDAYEYFGVLMVESAFRATFSSNDAIACSLCSRGSRLVTGSTRLRDRRFPTFRRVSRVMDLAYIASTFGGGC